MASSIQRSFIIRRLSILSLFFLVLTAAFGIYFYYYLPNNRAELNERGARVLNQLTSNFLQKNEDAIHAFDEAYKKNDTFIHKLNLTYKHTRWHCPAWSKSDIIFRESLL